MTPGDQVRAWLPNPDLPRGGVFLLGEVTGDEFSDGALGVCLQGTGGVVAKVPPFHCFEVST